MFGSKRLRIRLVRTKEQAAWKRKHVQPQASKIQFLHLRGTPRVSKSKTKQALILCRHDEYGIGDLKRRVMIRQTYLYRELMLRLNARKITDTYFCSKEKGLFNWKAYKKHKESIQKSFDILRRALARYKQRRIRAGYFYMCKNRSLHSVFVMSPLYIMPRKEALMKIKQTLQKREAYSSTSNKTTTGTHLSNLAGHLWLRYIFVIVIACIIIFYD
jgi:hypothetical protein